MPDEDYSYLELIERIEIIGKSGREFTAYYQRGIAMELQNDGRTLKIFVGQRLSEDEVIDHWKPTP